MHSRVPLASQTRSRCLVEGVWLINHNFARLRAEPKEIGTQLAELGGGKRHLLNPKLVGLPVVFAVWLARFDAGQVRHVLRHAARARVLLRLNQHQRLFHTHQQAQALAVNDIHDARQVRAMPDHAQQRLPC